MGNLLTAQKHYFATFSGTVTADTIRFFFSLAVALGKKVLQMDAKCAYLQSDEQAPLCSAGGTAGVVPPMSILGMCGTQYYTSVVLNFGFPNKRLKCSS